MVSFRVRGVRVGSLDRSRFAALLERAQTVGGRDSFPILYSLADSESELDPDRFVDELQRLGAALAGADEAASVGALRDDLFEALAAADEG